MFSESEDWDSTENQDIFIKSYFGKEKVLSQKAGHASKQSDDFGTIHPKKNSKNINSSSSTNHIGNKRALDCQVESSKKGKKLSNNSLKDNCTKSCENGMDFQEIHMESCDSNLPSASNIKTKKKKKKSKKHKSISKDESTEQISIEELPSETENSIDIPPLNLSVKTNNLFQNKIHQKLQAARFRYLNEMLYTNSGKDALSYFQQNTDEFEDYHVGYQSQVSKWPINPVDIIIQEISRMNKQAVIADLGCGEARIAKAFPKRTVHSFDLIALKDCVTACDMANVPLPSNSIDVTVFCLSLMGTNWKDYVIEGHRLLKQDGILKIAEIESRIEDLHSFIKNIENYGFSLVNKDVSHKMFVFLNFKKVKRSKKSSKVPGITLKPCLYKKR